MHPYVGNILTAGFTAKSLEDDTVLSEYLNYQWYRVKPLSFEMTAIDGANSLTYESTEDDAGYGHICRATGDGEYTGGFAQVFSTETIKIPNMAYVENVSDTGFTLNLYKSVPGGLSIDDLKLTYYNGDGEQVITISDITAAANNATFTITADMSDIPAGTTIDLINESYFWQLVSEHGEGMILITLE